MVSCSLTLGWFPVKPKCNNIKGQKVTSLLLDYVRDVGNSVNSPNMRENFTARLFPVAKKETTKKRMVLDFLRLNKYIPCKKFQMTTTKVVRQVMDKHSWLATLDLKSAYWHVPVHHKFQNLFGFRLGQQAYKFRAHPFGLTTAPCILRNWTTGFCGPLSISVLSGNERYMSDNS